MENTTFSSDGLWIFALLILLFGGGGFGFGNRQSTDQAVANNEILSGQKFDTLSRQVNQVGDGISSLGYSQLQNMSNSFASVNGNITAEGRALQSQIADCCCNNQRNTDAIRYDLANFNNAIQNAIHTDGEQTRAMIYQNKIDALTAQVNQLQMAQAVCGIPKVSTYAWGTYPYNATPACCNTAI